MHSIENLNQILGQQSEKHGPEVRSRFTNLAVKKLDPMLLNIVYYLSDSTGEKWTKATYADGTPNPHWPEGEEAPRDPEERKKFFLDIRAKQINEWAERLESGEFNQVVTIEGDADVPSVDEDHQDVTNLDVEVEPEAETPPVSEGVTIVQQDEPEDKVERYEAEEAEAEEESEDIIADGEGFLPKGTNVTKWEANSLLTHLRSFVQEHAPTPEVGSETMKHLTDLQTAIDKIEKRQDKMAEAIKKLSVAMTEKVPELIKQEILKKFS